MIEDIKGQQMAYLKYLWKATGSSARPATSKP